MATAASASDAMNNIGELNGGKRIQQNEFPFRLYEVLEEADESIISWQPHGRCFMIRDPNKFEQEVLPRYVYPE